MKQILSILVLFLFALQLFGAQLSSIEKGKKSKEEVLSGSIVSFKDSTLTFRVSGDSGNKVPDTKPVELDVSRSATQYEMQIIVDDSSIKGSVDHDNGIIQMSYPSQTKDTDFQRAIYHNKDKWRNGIFKGPYRDKNKDQNGVFKEPEERDLSSCHSRGKDRLLLKDGSSVNGTMTEISVAGQTAFVYFQASGAKSPTRYRFDELSIIGIGGCP